MTIEQKRHCSHCKRWLSQEDFGPNNYRPDGLQYWCKECMYEARRRYRTSEKGKAANRRYKKGTAGKAANRRYKRGSAGKAAMARRLQTNPQARLAHFLYVTIRHALRKRGVTKTRRTFDTLGYTVEDLRKHLKATLPAGYTWVDFMSGKLHIDHVIPIVAFNFSSMDDTDFHRCFALENLQLLPAAENIRKGAKLLTPFQPSLGI